MSQKPLLDNPTLKKFLPKTRRRQAALAAVLAAALLLPWACSGGSKNPKPAGGGRVVVQELPLPPLSEQSQGSSYWQDEEVRAGDTLEIILARLGIEAGSIRDLMAQSPVDLKSLKLHSGQIVSVRADAEQHVTDVQFFNDDDNGERNLVALERVNGRWQHHTAAADTETLPSLRSAVITTSAAGALARAGVPVEVRISLKEIFSGKVNLDELKEGDSVRVLYESLYFRGQEIATGNILAAEITAGGQTYYGYYFEQGESREGSREGNYYDENGQPLKEGFAGLPIEHYTRISSPYGIRIHPVLHTVRMHTGIDYAAPTGTRILAPSDGVVNFRGTKGGYGYAVMIDHGNGLETLYGHMSAFVEGVNVGTHVRAGQVIGLVGSTGRSTGPHLHYEVRINGQHVNPASVALPVPKLTPVNIGSLQNYRAKIDTLMSAVRGLPGIVSQKD